MLTAGQTPEENFRNLHAAGCIQTLCDIHEDVEDAFKASYAKFCLLMVATTMDPCGECPAWIGCSAYKKYKVVEKIVDKRKSKKEATTPNNGIGTLSVKQIADQYGVSKSQVRRLKVQGKLNSETLKKLGEENLQVKP